jgi:hypothetical protein
VWVQRLVRLLVLLLLAKLLVLPERLTLPYPCQPSMLTP